MENEVEVSGLLAWSVGFEPLDFHHASSEGRGLLLVLAGKVVLAYGAAEMFEEDQRFAFGMQSFARSAPNCASAIGRPDDMDLVFFCYGWKPDQIPVFLLQDVSHQIILMKPLHDNDDATRPFIIEPAVKCVVKPVIHCPALGFRECLIRFQRIINNDEVRASSGEHSAHRSG